MDLRGGGHACGWRRETGCGVRGGGHHEGEFALGDVIFGEFEADGEALGEG